MGRSEITLAQRSLSRGQSLVGEACLSRRALACGLANRHARYAQTSKMLILRSRHSYHPLGRFGHKMSSPNAKRRTPNAKRKCASQRSLRRYLFMLDKLRLLQELIVVQVKSVRTHRTGPQTESKVNRTQTQRSRADESEHFIDAGLPGIGIP